MTSPAATDIVRAMVEIAILAKAPVPGFCKTRLIPTLGADGAARLQGLLIERAVQAALAADIGRVTLWCAPDVDHPAFQALAPNQGLHLARQPEGDLGARMHAAVVAAQGPCLVIGTDCPGLDQGVLRQAAYVIREGDDVMIPALDGGYVLIGLRHPLPALFDSMAWSTDLVAAETRRRAAALDLKLAEMLPLGDVDTPHDLHLVDLFLPYWRESEAPCRPTSARTKA